MLEVAAVVEFLHEHWQGPAVAWRVAVGAALLHDMANIIKFKRPFLGDLEADAAHWQHVQADWIARYGTDVAEATKQVIEQLTLRTSKSAVLQTLGGMRLMFDGQEDGITWETRVLEYADCCVTPIGIEGFEPRMRDLQLRYEKHDTAWQEPFRANAIQVQNAVDVDLVLLPDQDFSQAIKRLADWEV